MRSVFQDSECAAYNTQEVLFQGPNFGELKVALRLHIPVGSYMEMVETTSYLAPFCLKLYDLSDPYET